MKLKKILRAALFIAAVSVAAVSCKSGEKKDAEIKAAVEEKMKASPDMAGVAVAVKDAVVTLTGEVKDAATKTATETAASSTTDVKSVTNNCTVAPPPPPVPASVTTMLDDATQQKVKDGMKDIKGVTYEFVGEKVVLTGEVTKADRMKIMQMLAAAKAKSDVSKLMDKK
ncbi:MAG: BON domain-containing protein [Ferruginibacter sp.]